MGGIIDLLRIAASGFWVTARTYLSQNNSRNQRRAVLLLASAGGLLTVLMGQGASSENLAGGVQEQDSDIESSYLPGESLQKVLKPNELFRYQVTYRENGLKLSGHVEFATSAASDGGIAVVITSALNGAELRDTITIPKGATIEAVSRNLRAALLRSGHINRRGYYLAIKALLDTQITSNTWGIDDSSLIALSTVSSSSPGLALAAHAAMPRVIGRAQVANRQGRIMQCVGSLAPCRFVIDDQLTLPVVQYRSRDRLSSLSMQLEQVSHFR